MTEVEKLIALFEGRLHEAYQRGVEETLTSIREVVWQHADVTLEAEYTAPAPAEPPPPVKRGRGRPRKVVQ